MGKIERTGTFIGTVEESTLGQSSNGFPQWVARLKATKLYVNDKDLMTHFGITEPGYVDWSTYDESIVAYMVLFTDKGPLKNYEQLQAATGWEGSDFQDLTTFVGKTILFRVEENTYKDQVSLQVNWIDAQDAPPERTLKSVEPDKIKDLNARFLAGMKKPAKPAVPARATAAVPPVAPAAPTLTFATLATPTPSPAPAPAAPAAAAPAKKAPAKKTPPPPPPAEALPEGLPAQTSKEAAWEYVNQVRGTNDEGVVAEAWIAATNEVGESIDEANFTPEMWAKVRNIILKDLGVTK